jgi:hypothetical protein
MINKEGNAVFVPAPSKGECKWLKNYGMAQDIRLKSSKLV